MADEGRLNNFLSKDETKMNFNMSWYTFLDSLVEARYVGE